MAHDLTADVDRRCAECSGAIPEGKRFDARYCSDRCRRNRYDRSTRGVRLRLERQGLVYRCDQCGRHTSRLGGTCAQCATRERARGRRETIVRLWADGLSLVEIGAAVGMSRTAVGVLMHEMRGQGYHLPYRQHLAAPRFPKQVAEQVAA